MTWRDKFKTNLFWKTCRFSTKDKKALFFIFLADVALIASLFLLNTIFTFVLKPENIRPTLSSIFFSFFTVIIYFAVIILVYSTAKFLILQALAKLVGKKMGCYWKFYLLNIILFLFIVVGVIIFFILFPIFGSYKMIFAVLYWIIFALKLYFISNYMHFHFICDQKIGGLIKVTMSAWTKSVRLYAPFMSLLAMFLLISVIFLVIGFFLKNILFGSFESYLEYYPTYRTTFVVFFYLFLYMVIFYNRFLFLKLMHEK